MTKEQCEQGENTELENRPDGTTPPSIRGWLFFFLLIVVVGALFSLVYTVATFEADDYAGIHALAIFDIVWVVMLFSLALYILYAFVRRKPNAVYLGKMYVVASFLSNLLVLVMGGLPETGFESAQRTVGALVWAVIWFLYLSFSEQVKELIPLESREKSKSDYYICGAFVLIPIFLMSIGIVSAFGSRAEEEAAMMREVRLMPGEYTDGRIVFKCPEGFICERRTTDFPGTVIFDFAYGEEVWGAVCSDYDTDTSVKNFDSYWAGWQNTELAEYEYVEHLSERREINGRPCHVKRVEYQSWPTCVWTYALIFDDATEKVCVVSLYQLDRKDHIEEILASVRFGK